MKYSEEIASSNNLTAYSSGFLIACLYFIGTKYFINITLHSELLCISARGFYKDFGDLD